jgi:hypothetical protein
MYEVGQKLEVYGLPVDGGDSAKNGEIVTVAKPKGYLPNFSQCYGVKFKDGKILPAIEKYLRPFPPSCNRRDIDDGSTWDQFQKATGIDPDTIRNPDGVV